MSDDEQGFVWLSDPWIAVMAIAAVIGLFLWCQLRLAREIASQLEPVAVRADPARRGQAVRSRSGTRPVTRRTTSCADGAFLPRRRVA